MSERACTMPTRAAARNRKPARRASGILSIEIAPDLWLDTDDLARWLTHPGRRMVCGQLVTRPARALEVSR